MDSSLISLFLILAAGSLIGRISVKGISLGAGGVLFASLAAGHFGASVAREVGEVGIVLFMYAAGLRAGPRFFRTFRKQSIVYLALGSLPLICAALFIWLSIHLGFVSREQGAGIFAASLTSTSALASALDVVSEDSGEAMARASEAYGLTYPFGLIAVIVLIRLLPAISKQSLLSAEQQWTENLEQEEPPLKVTQFRITNHNCHGKRIADLKLRNRADINISRVDRGDQSFAASSDLVLQTADVVTLVGVRDSLDEFEILFGEKIKDYVPMSHDIKSVDIELSEPALTEVKLRELNLSQRHRVIVTRIKRQGIEFSPNAASALEIGDQIRIVGQSADVVKFSDYAGARSYLVDETAMMPFAVGILLGLLLGIVSLSFFGLFDIRIGYAGGVFLVGLLAGHFGRIGRFRFYVPQAASNLCQELGVILFLASAGSLAGASLLSGFARYGWSVVIVGMLTTLVACCAYLAICGCLKLNLLARLGGLSGVMTSGSALATLRNMSQSELPAVTYAAIFPVALFTKILLAHLLMRF